MQGRVQPVAPQLASSTVGAAAPPHATAQPNMQRVPAGLVGPTDQQAISHGASELPPVLQQQALHVGQCTNAALQARLANEHAPLEAAERREHELHEARKLAARREYALQQRVAELEAERQQAAGRPADPSPAASTTAAEACRPTSHAQPCAATPSAGLHQDAARHLVSLYGMYVSRNMQRTEALRARRQPISLPADKLVRRIGKFFPLVGYAKPVDSLVRALLQLEDDWCNTPADSFIEGLQLLRVVGAPGIGKSTYVSAVWGMVLERMQRVAEEDHEQWEKWKAQCGEQLLERLQSWLSPAGPLVVSMDMSEADLRELNPWELQLSDQAQAAARILWASLDLPLALRSYESFLQHLQAAAPGVLPSLSLLTVMYFIRYAAGLQTSSALVVVWDEANVVAGPPCSPATFFQRHLTALVAARKQCRALADPAVLDMLPVLVVASTRGSSSTLTPPFSRKSLIRDLRVPLPCTLEQQKLVVMDVVRRLPLPADVANQLGVWQVAPRELDLALLDEEQRSALASTCPKHVEGVLQWVGGNMRLLGLALGALAGGRGPRCHDLNLGSFSWLQRPMTHDELVNVLDTLTAVLMESGWRAWIVDASKSVYVMFAVTYACCNIPASRLTEWRGEHGAVTMQMLEADGVVVLLLPDGATIPTPCSGHIDDASTSTPAQHASSAEADAIDPNWRADLTVAMPPLVLRAAGRHVYACEADVARPKLPRTLSAEDWHAKETDGLCSFAMKAQLLTRFLGWRTVLLRQLLSRVACFPSLENLTVLVPGESFTPRQIPRKEVDIQQLANSVASQQQHNGQPPAWLFLFNGSSGPGDGLVCLRVVDEQGVPDGRIVAISLQCKLSVADHTTVTPELLMDEVEKVPVLNDPSILQLFLLATDHHVSTLGATRRAAAHAAGVQPLVARAHLGQGAPQQQAQQRVPQQQAAQQRAPQQQAAQQRPQQQAQQRASRQQAQQQQQPQRQPRQPHRQSLRVQMRHLSVQAAADELPPWCTQNTLIDLHAGAAVCDPRGLPIMMLSGEHQCDLHGGLMHIKQLL